MKCPLDQTLPQPKIAIFTWIGNLQSTVSGWRIKKGQSERILHLVEQFVHLHHGGNEMTTKVFMRTAIYSRDFLPGENIF
jgi:hypothetical protein